MTNAYRRFLVLVGAACVVTVGFAAALTRYADPYWLSDPRPFRDDSPALDVQMRLSKAVQLISREWEVPLKVVLIGSSTVYRGLNPAALDYPAGAVYNLGISSLRMQEAHAYVRHLLKFSSPEIVVLGLDFFQFDGLRQSEPGFEPGLGTWSSVIEMFLTSVASADATLNSMRVLKVRRKEDAVVDPWSRNGYRKTWPRGANEIKAQFKSAVSIYQMADMRRAEPYDALSQTILLLQERNISVRLYLSPVHTQYEAAIRSVGKESQYLDWKQRVRDIAAKHRVRLVEIDRVHKFSDPDFNGESGFNDASHFSEWVGTTIMREIGLPVRSSFAPRNWEYS